MVVLSKPCQFEFHMLADNEEKLLLFVVQRLRKVYSRSFHIPNYLESEF